MRNQLVTWLHLDVYLSIYTIPKGKEIAVKFGTLKVSKQHDLNTFLSSAKVSKYPNF